MLEAQAAGASSHISDDARHDTIIDGLQDSTAMVYRYMRSGPFYTTLESLSDTVVAAEFFLE